MCGKFTAKLSWTELVDFAHTPAGDDENDRLMIYRVMDILPVILLDQETGARRVVPMRWGFPNPRDWQRPRPRIPEKLWQWKEFVGPLGEGNHPPPKGETELPPKAALRPIASLVLLYVA